MGPIYDFLTIDNKYYTVLVVFAVIWIGIWLHVWWIIRKLKRLERYFEEKR